MPEKTTQSDTSPSSMKANGHPRSQRVPLNSTNAQQKTPNNDGIQLFTFRGHDPSKLIAGRSVINTNIYTRIVENKCGEILLNTDGKQKKAPRIGINQRRRIAYVPRMGPPIGRGKEQLAKVSSGTEIQPRKWISPVLWKIVSVLLLIIAMSWAVLQSVPKEAWLQSFDTMLKPFKTKIEEKELQEPPMTMYNRFLRSLLRVITLD